MIPKFLQAKLAIFKTKWFVFFVVIFCVCSAIIERRMIATEYYNHMKFKVTADNSYNEEAKIIPSFFESYIIPQPGSLLSSHSASLEVLQDGSLIAVWFAGSHEGRPDVSIWQSYFKNGKWSIAETSVTRKYLSNEAKILIRKLGNPVIYKAVDNVLHLFVVSVSLGGWSGSSINQLISKDNGHTWKFVCKLVISPIFNISTLVRTSAISLSDGGFYLPVYNEFIRTYPELLFFNRYGIFEWQERLNNVNHLLQPSMVVVSEESAFVYFRNHVSNNPAIYLQQTNNAGYSWSNLGKTNIYNQDSSIATANLGNNQLLMLRNINNRGVLALSSSKDGINWHNITYLENLGNGHEFSYPAIKYHDNIVDILYTYERKYIKHVRFNLSWFVEQENKHHYTSDKG